MANDLVVEVGDLVGPTIAVRILQDLDRIAAIAHMGALGVHSAVLLGSIRILDRAADPEATFGIEGHVDRFVDHRLAGEKLNLPPRCVQLRLPLLRRQSFGFAHQAQG